MSGKGASCLHFTCMYPPPNMTCMYPPPLVELPHASGKGGSFLLPLSLSLSPSPSPTLPLPLSLSLLLSFALTTDFIYVLGAKPEQRDLIRVLYGLSWGGKVRFDKSCNAAAQHCVSVYGVYILRVGSIVASHSKCTRALTFENFCLGSTLPIFSCQST